MVPERERDHRRHLHLAETFGNRLSAFELTDEGKLTRRRVFAEFGPLPTTSNLDDALPTLSLAPDGISADGEGGVWIADATGSRLVHVDKSGTIIEEVHPGTRVFACLLGGSAGRTLFACAAPDFHDDARKAATEGRLIALSV